jgi:hypothetical protein
MINIQVWKWARESDKFIIALEGETLFEDAAVFRAEWNLLTTLKFLSALQRPIPEGFSLILARRKQSFPYNTSELMMMDDVFNPVGRGAFFLASRPQLDQLAQLTKLSVK